MDNLWEAVIALVTLTSLEIVLGIDNIVFIAILSNKLPKEEQNKARRLGLVGAMVMRILLLLVISWIIKLTDDWLSFNVLGTDVALSWKDIILIVGGLFLIAKATHEIHHKLEGDEDHLGPKPKAKLFNVVMMIMAMDIIFSLDSVITAVGMVPPELLWVMITSVVIAIVVMLIFARPISNFVERHPTVKMLALSFLLLIGVMLVADGFDAHIPKGYIYFAMAFSLFVEILNLRLRKVSKPRQLKHTRLPE
jgi:predicted tellurium resistance membrane protein TerC